MKYKLKLDYTADELKELKRFSTDYHSPMNAIKRIVKEGVVGDQLGHLRKKYLAMEYEDEFNFMADVNNVVMGTAILPEEKYVVHDKVTDQYIYYSFPWKGLRWGSLQLGTGAERKTKDEWLEINPAYEPMLERVEDDEWNKEI